MNIILKLPFLSDSRNSLLKNTQIFYLILSVLTILYITQSYRIFLKAADLVYLLRVTEDYVLLCIFLIFIIYHNQIKFRALAPFVLLFSYASIYYILTYEFDFIRGFTLIMLFYTVGINVVTYLKPNHFFYILTLVGIISALTFLINIERSFSEYIVESMRIHAEGEGINMNANNIALIMVSITTAVTVLRDNMSYIKYSDFLITTLYVAVAFVILITSTRSAGIFYLILIAYNLSKIGYMKLFLFLFLFLLLILTTIWFNENTLISDLNILDRTINSNYQSSERFMATYSSLSIFSDQPLFGVSADELSLVQMDKIGAIDHNFYAKLLGSNGLIGFFFVMLFFNSITTKFSKNVNGFYLLKAYFFYSLIFTPQGPGMILIAVVIYYLSELRALVNVHPSKFL